MPAGDDFRACRCARVGWHGPQEQAKAKGVIEQGHFAAVALRIRHRHAPCELFRRS
jgi:hypothetical protein